MLQETPNTKRRRQRRAAGQCADCGTASARYRCPVCAKVLSTDIAAVRARTAGDPLERTRRRLQLLGSLLVRAEEGGHEVPVDVLVTMTRVRSKLQRECAHSNTAPMRELVQLAEKLVERSLATYRGKVQ